MRFLLFAFALSALVWPAAIPSALAQGGPSQAPPPVTVAKPVVKDIIERTDFIGRFEAINQVDIRFAKVLTYGRSRTIIGVDLFNALNVNTPTSYNQTYGPAWLTPTGVLQARFIKLSAQIDW